MNDTPRILLCDDPSLAVEFKRLATELSFEVSPVVETTPWNHLPDETIAIAALNPPTPKQLANIKKQIALALFNAPASIVALASELGFPCVQETRPLLSLLALRSTTQSPWMASTKSLERLDRQRLSLFQGPKTNDRFLPLDDGKLAYESSGKSITVGNANDVLHALIALQSAVHKPRPKMPRVEGIDTQSVIDVILGPPRTLSDPASKATLAIYDIPLPTEELCLSASRAASEASRIGFPVRVALASPDLRVGTYPELAVDRVESAARVRDVFRQLVTLANTRCAEARILGVTVSATTFAEAELNVRARYLKNNLVLADIGFQDPHGLAAADQTVVVLPCRPDDLEKALRRLRGHSLLFGNTANERRNNIRTLGDALLRVATFLNDWKSEIASVELCPLALLVGGQVEVREASIEITDTFQLSLDAFGDGDGG